MYSRPAFVGWPPLLQTKTSHLALTHRSRMFAITLAPDPRQFVSVPRLTGLPTESVLSFSCVFDLSPVCFGVSFLLFLVFLSFGVYAL